MFWLATGKLRLAFPQVLRNLLMYQTKKNTKEGYREHIIILHDPSKWEVTKLKNLQKKLFYQENKNASRRQVLLSQHVFSSNPPGKSARRKKNPL